MSEEELNDNAEGGEMAGGALVVRLTAEVARLKDEALRALADGENTKRRAALDAARREKYAVSALALEMLPVIDSLERALALESPDGPFKDGIGLTLDSARAGLAKFGVAPVESLGQPFDPSVHHAVQEQETADAPAGTVVQEWQKGYMLADRVLREAAVVVAKAPAAKTSEGEA
ncbi:hypothetical protein FACS1894186_3080 [Alphaproteobacteria bacterium]|nr:hypothetical protein FACS1894186_3080 [Alphaproteobacteria bacterium]